MELPAAGARAAAGRALRRVLGAYLEELPEAVALTPAAAGKPALATPRPALCFNLSHSGGLALIAVGPGGTEVGIDVERVRPRRDLTRLAARWLPGEDAAAVRAAADEEREAVFYAAWTRHEARIKCTGGGLSGPPPGPDVTALALAVDPGYAAALATAAATPIRVRRFEFPAGAGRAGPGPRGGSGRG